MDWIHTLADWLLANEMPIEVFAVWAMTAASALLSLSGITLWASTVGSKDKTAFGRALKALMLMLGIYGAMKATYWGLVLWGYYHQTIFARWQELSVAFGMSAVSLGICVVIMIVMHAYRKENWGRPRRVKVKKRRPIRLQRRKLRS